MTQPQGIGIDHHQQVAAEGHRDDLADLEGAEVFQCWRHPAGEFIFVDPAEISAALGLSQLDSLDGFIQRREALVARYDEQLKDLPLIRPVVSPGRRSSWHLYVVQVDEQQCAADRRSVFDSLRQSGIGVNVHYIPVHTHPYYRALGFQAGDFPEAERYYARAITLPLYPGLTDAEQDEVVEALGVAAR